MWKVKPGTNLDLLKLFNALVENYQRFVWIFCE